MIIIHPMSFNNRPLSTGSMDDLLVNCPALLKRPINNKVLVSLGSKFNKMKTDGPVRKTSVSSLEEMRRKEEKESLNRVSSTPSLKSPVRTPVTENDPLGALCLEKEMEEGGGGTQNLPSLETTRNVSSEIELDCTGTPILFDRRKQKWDSSRKTSLTHSVNSGIDHTSDEEDDDDIDTRLKELNDSTSEEAISRASTLPADERDRGDHGSPFKTSLGNFKLPFRYVHGLKMNIASCTYDQE